jgi:bacteriocin-like protein
MAKSEQPSKPTSPDKLVEADKENKPVLTDDELKKVTGGASTGGGGKAIVFDKNS